MNKRKKVTFFLLHCVTKCPKPYHVEEGGAEANSFLRSEMERTMEKKMKRTLGEEQKKEQELLVSQGS